MRPVRAKALLFAWCFEKLLPLQGDNLAHMNHPGRCPGLGASALSGRVGQTNMGPTNMGPTNMGQTNMGPTTLGQNDMGITSNAMVLIN